VSSHVLICALCLGLVSACVRIDKRAFADLDRAGTAKVTALDRKVALPEYRALVHVFSTEVGHARTRSRSSNERALIDDYEAARANLEDMLAVWELKDEHDAERLPIADVLPGRLARQYSLPINTNEPPSIYASEALGAIWEATRAKLNRASQTLNR
jgi:hypothetical protein